MNNYDYYKNMIEETLERYSNSGHYTYSLKYIFSVFNDYFDFFEKADFRLPNRREPKDLFPLNVTLKPVKMGV